MHGISVHSALAIKRQRRRRELAKKKTPRRYSNSSAAIEFENARARSHRRESILATKVIGTVTMFHIGSVFCFVGSILLLAPLIMYGRQSQKETAELVGTSAICLVIGIFLICLNRVYGKREEQDLENYVKTRLGKSQSGGMIYKEEDLEEQPEEEDKPQQQKKKEKKKRKDKSNPGPTTTTQMQMQMQNEIEQV